LSERLGAPVGGLVLQRGSQGSGQGTPLPLLFFESRKRDGFPGTVFQKDLGPKTAKLVRKINSFSPDDTWTKVDAIQ
jgi:Protein of unknown function (DUF2950)